MVEIVLQKPVKFNPVAEISLFSLLFSHLCRKAAEEGIPEMDEGEGEILVKEIAQELAHAQIRPASVHQQEAL